jgi:hypothetical protein
MQPEMEYTPESSNVEEIGYDADAEEVWVRFRNGGRLYKYSNVPPVVWDEFRVASSKGTFVNRVLKPSYPDTRM